MEIIVLGNLVVGELGTHKQFLQVSLISNFVKYRVLPTGVYNKTIQENTWSKV